MDAAGKKAQCSCGAVSDVVCEGCGDTVCSKCFTRQIAHADKKHLRVKHYCPTCALDIRKDVWGGLYWKSLFSLSE